MENRGEMEVMGEMEKNGNLLEIMILHLMEEKDKMEKYGFKVMRAKELLFSLSFL